VQNKEEKGTDQKGTDQEDQKEMVQKSKASSVKEGHSYVVKMEDLRKRLASSHF
jgi:hypothetical protein